MSEELNKYTLTRMVSIKSGTFGWLALDGMPFCLTLEPAVPIIPPGTYHCRRRFSFKRNQEVYQLEAVPGHDYVQLHRLNVAVPLQKKDGNGNEIVHYETEGCIGVGMGWYKFDPVEIPGLKERTLGLANSKTAFLRLMNEQEGDILLEVI
jgi:hypothetical protein